MQIEIWPLSRIKAYAKNARNIPQAAIDKVAVSLREFGWRQPMVVEPDGTLIVGHVRFAGALQNGWTEGPVNVAHDLTPAQIKAYRLMDNRSHDEATWNFELLGPELIDLKTLDFDLKLTGFEMGEIRQATASKGLTDPDEVPPVPAEPVTRLGDLWLMCEHRLLCGSTAEPRNIDRLCGSHKIGVMLADPPYGVGYSGGRGCVRKEFANDSLDSDEYGEFLRSCLEAWNPHVAPKAPLYIWFADRQGEAVYRAVRLAGWKKTAVIIWAKQHFIFSRAIQQYHQQHEPCVYATRGVGLADWVGPMNETTLWNVDRPMASKDHPTQKPVELYRRSIGNSIPGDAVAGEMFLGSGSALLAAEEIGRNCYATELAPEYVDVAVQRWQNFTGQEATLEGDGRTFAQVAQERAAIASSV